MSGAPPKTEWMFGSIPDHELEVACWYEFAREAERELCRLAEWRRRLQSVETKASTWHTDRWYAQRLRDAVLSMFRTEQRQGMALPFLQWTTNPRYKIAMIENQKPVFEPPPPWVLLTEIQKTQMGEIFKGWIHKWVDPLPCRILPWENLDQRIQLHAGGAELIGKKYQLPDGPLPGVGGDAMILLNIDVTHRSNTEILAEFERLLPQIREQVGAYFGDAAKGPSMRGKKKTDFAKRLSSLGIMRLRHSMEPDDVIATVEAWDLSLWKDRDEVLGMPEKRELMEESRARVLEWFRSLFPQLGPTAEPDSYKTLRERGL